MSTMSSQYMKENNKSSPVLSGESLDCNNPINIPESFQSTTVLRTSVDFTNIHPQLFMSDKLICMPCEKQKYINACVECGINMGDSNPRQYCGKFRCIF